MGIIALSARNAFLARDRRDFREYKKLTDEQLEQRMLKLPVKPPIYYKLTHLQKVCFIIGVETQRFCFFNSTGCVDGKTLLETDKGAIRIDQLEQEGNSIQVLSKTEQGLRYVPATAPFKLGPAALYEVSFASGKKMVVTAKHRFWTERGFVACESLSIGECLPRFEVCHHQTNSGTFLLEFLQDASHWLKKLQDLKDRCYQYYHLCDEQLHLALSSDQVQLPLVCEKEEPNQDQRLFEHMDGQDIGLANNLDRHILSSSIGSIFDRPFPNCRGSQVYEHEILQQLHQSRRLMPNRINDNHHECIVQDQALEFASVDHDPESHLFRNLLASKTSSDRVINIKYARTDFYYDLHVPEHENYIAEGFCHHNTGKSLLAIALVRYFRRLGILKHALILIPNKINKHEWYYELQKHSPKSSSLILQGSSVDKWKALEQSNDLFVFETYAGLTRMICDSKKNKKGKNKLVPNEKKVNLLAKHFQAIICDESVRVGHHTSLPFRFCRKLSKTAQAVFTMTGTPFNRDPSLLWAQMFLTDNGYTLGETLGLFRAIFCNESENFFSGAPEYKFNKKQQHLLNDFIANRSIAYPADEGSLPKCVEIQKIIKLPEDAGAYYQRMRDQLVAAQGNFTEMKNAFVRMRQISSGFMGYEDDETGEKAKFEFPDNPKLDSLLSLIQSIDPEHKVIVFVDFNYSGERILRELKEAKITAGLLYGKTKDVEQVRDAFVNDKKQQVLILQNRMGVGLNLQCSRYGIYFESPVSAVDRVQCDGRFVRQHSLYKTVFKYDLLMENTVDSQILAYHREGGDLFEAIIKGKNNSK